MTATRSKKAAGSRVKPKTRRQKQADALKKRMDDDRRVYIAVMPSALKQRRRKLEQDSEAWLWEMMGPGSGIMEELTRKFSSQQCEMIGIYNQVLQYGGDELMLASRGEGKTTYLRGMIWKSQSAGEVDFVAYIGATGADAGNSQDAIQHMTENSKPFRKLYPEIAIPVKEVGRTSQRARTMIASGHNWADGRKKFEDISISFQWSAAAIDYPMVPGSPAAGAMFRAKGADSPIRGLNILGRRPGVVCMDDLDTPDTVNNSEVADKVIRRVDTDIGGLGTQTQPLARIMLATMPQEACGVAHHYATQGFPFVVRQFKFLTEKPIRWDLWKEYVKKRRAAKNRGDTHARAAHRFYVENFDEMNAGAVVSNPHRFIDKVLPDGTQTQLTALQFYFDAWADKGEYYCRCELDNEIIKLEDVIESSLEPGHILNCEGTADHNIIPADTTMITRGVDVRKIELHSFGLAGNLERPHRIFDYDLRTHGTSETTVQQAEEKILKALQAWADEWESQGVLDENGNPRQCDLTLIDKGWMGNWTEDGEKKTWATQPVETFCMKRGLRRYLPARGAPNYKKPAPNDKIIVGDNWHMNRGAGAERSCTEVIWNANHWHGLVEELFMLEDSDPDRFELFLAPEEGFWKDHQGIIRHIIEGSKNLAAARRAGTDKRKPGFRHDHWWDSAAMALVARSIEFWFRQNLKRGKGKPSGGRMVRQPQPSEEIGAR